MKINISFHVNNFFFHGNNSQNIPFKELRREIKRDYYSLRNTAFTASYKYSTLSFPSLKSKSRILRLGKKPNFC